MRRTRRPRVQTPIGRSGLTLVEVLMSLMVTGIGILGVIALLPLAFVRAVQATNLTNGTILRFNAESHDRLQSAALAALASTAGLLERNAQVHVIGGGHQRRRCS